MKNKIYVFAEAVLFGLILYGNSHFSALTVSRLKYLCIVINFVMIVVSRERKVIIDGALALTLAADTFLVLLNDHYAVGVFFFCLVQALYAWEVGLSIKRVYVRAGFWLVIVVLLKVSESLNFLTLLSAFSYSQLLLSAFFSWNKPSCFSWGLALFLLCDSCVGLFNASGYIAGFPEMVGTIAGSLIWVFYVPSQVLITLSALKNDQTENKNVLLMKGMEYGKQPE